MKSRIVAAALALSFAGFAAHADSQLAASAGLSTDAAAGLGLHEIARHKFNADTRGDDRMVVVIVEGYAGPGGREQLVAAGGADSEGSLTEIAEAAFRAGARGDDRMPVVRAGEVGPEGRAYLAAAGRVDPDVARSMTTHEIFLAGIVRRSNDD